jgi:hypothetical protein
VDVAAVLEADDDRSRIANLGMRGESIPAVVDCSTPFPRRHVE